MLTKAIAKVKSEMDQNNNNSYVQVVGGFLLQHLDENPGAAEKILVEGKTIAKSLDEMRKTAEKKKVRNCAMFTPQEGFEIVLKYFDIKAETPSFVSHSSEIEVYKPVAVEKKSADFDINLEDLLL